MYSTPEGSFTISLYPTGDKLSNQGETDTCDDAKCPLSRVVMMRIWPVHMDLSRGLTSAVWPMTGFIGVYLTCLSLKER